VCLVKYLEIVVSALFITTYFQYILGVFGFSCLDAVLGFVSLSSFGTLEGNNNNNKHTGR